MSDASNSAPTDLHFVLKNPIHPPYPARMARAVFAMGCFWGAERCFWTAPGVYTTAVGYTGGHVENPTYEQVCSRQSGHAEAVLVVYDPEAVGFDQLLQLFWTAHDPTQGDRQGNDLGSQYRSGIYVNSDAELAAALASRQRYQAVLSRAGYGPITTEICPAGKFYHAERTHQQYLGKNPGGYCGLGGTGLPYPAL